MKCRIQQEPDELRLSISGNFEPREVVYFSNFLSRIDLQAHPRIAIDLSGVSYLSFKGMGVISEIMMRAAAAGSHCRLVNINPAIRGVVTVRDSRKLGVLAAQAESGYTPFF